jgi:hypothetical protein
MWQAAGLDQVADPLPPDNYLFFQLVETGLVTVFFS